MNCTDAPVKVSEEFLDFVQQVRTQATTEVAPEQIVTPAPKHSVSTRAEQLYNILHEEYEFNSFCFIVAVTEQSRDSVLPIHLQLEEVPSYIENFIEFPELQYTPLYDFSARILVGLQVEIGSGVVFIAAKPTGMVYFADWHDFLASTRFKF